MRHLRAYAVAPLAALSVMACAPAPGGTDELAGSTSMIQGGAADKEHTFAVGIKVANGGVCTGVLIAPNLVMTAQHCVSRSYGTEKIGCATSRFKVKPVKAPDVTITTETQLKGADKTYSVSNVIVPYEQAVCGSDLALLVLSKSVPSKEAKLAVPLLSAMNKTKSLTGEIAAIGYGVTSKTAKDAGERRIKESIAINCIPGGNKDCGKRSESDREFRTAGGACSGDSGSGAFEQSTLDGDDPLVLGVLSRVTYKGEKCTEGVYTRTDAYASLIVAAGVQAWRKARGTSDAYTAPAWTGVSDETSEEVETTFASADADSLSGSDDFSDILSTVGDIFANIDWEEVISFVTKIVPQIFKAIDLSPPREDTSKLLEATTTDPFATETDPGGERETEPEDKKDDDDKKKDPPASKPPSMGQTGGCSVALDPSSSSPALLLPALGALAVVARRRRRST